MPMWLFQTAYLKCHYPHEFMAALLTSVLDNTSKVIEYTTECQRLGIKVPSRTSMCRGAVSRRTVTASVSAWNAVKSVGRNLIEAVVKERQDRPYRGLYDFCRRMYGNELNRRALENLIKCGAFDTLEPSRAPCWSVWKAFSRVWKPTCARTWKGRWTFLV